VCLHWPPCVSGLQVLFCSLTGHQLGLYRAYLSSGEVEAILAGKRQVGSTRWARCRRFAWPGGRGCNRQCAGLQCTPLLSCRAGAGWH
jgi:hypothetical protein